MTGSQPTILVIDDEQQILRAMRTILGQHNYRVITASDGAEGLALATASMPDVIILDLGLPDMDGIEVCAQIRAWSLIPIIVLSARDNDTDKVSALDKGADDYLTKPFSVDELLARVRVALRHHSLVQGAKAAIIEAGDVTIDLSNHVVTRKGEDVKLSATEYKLLSYLVSNIGRVLTYRAILSNVWGYAEANQMEDLRVYILQLRRKLEENSRKPRLIITETGVGYRFVA
jgi:two-component system, OmpR family, KDP operon response regulator KdpE